MLLVDNEPLYRHGIKAVLQTQSAIQIIGEAAGTSEAIEQAAALLPDLVILEIMLPDGDGVAAIRTIRQQCPRTQVLVLTAGTDRDTFHEAMKAGAIGYLLKDIDPTTLMQAILSAGDGRRTLSPSVIEYIIEHYFSAFNGTGRGWEDTASGNERNDEPQLSQREIEVLAGVAQGLSDRQIGARLFLSESAVKTRLRAVYQKFRLRNRAQAAVFAIDKHLVDHERPGHGRTRSNSWPALR
ncbi:MAG TPA: response regulator transcription factor [bacterium]|nr:response regulator transcription factor [bacterium]